MEDIWKVNQTKAIFNKNLKMKMKIDDDKVSNRNRIGNRFIVTSLFLIVFMISLLVLVHAIPLTSFISNTPTTNIWITNTSIEINTSIIESSLGNITYNWNGTNYTMYNDSLVLMFNFDNLSSLGENGTNIVSAGMYSKNLSCTSCPTLTSGKYGNAYSFNGTDNALSISNAGLNFQANQKYTIEFWILPVSSAGLTAMGLAHHSGTYGTYGMDINKNANGTMGLAMRQGGGGDWFSVSSTSATSLNNWNHVAFVCDGSSITPYINGKASASGSLGSFSSYRMYDDYFSVGVSSWLSGYFNGSIDEVKIWNRSLTASEIYEQYVSNLQKYNSTQWYLYVNQSKNATAGLTDGTYTYQTFVTNSSGSLNSTELRTLTVDSTFPQINFTSPTPANGTSTTTTSVPINVSISEANLNSVIYNWNGTNYTIYNDSLVLMMNFDNLSSIGENSTYVVDVSKYGNNGTVSGALWNSSGKYRGAYQFDGTSKNITLPVLFTGNNPRTVSLWFNASAGQTSAGTVVGMFAIDGWATQKSFVLTVRDNDCPNNGVGIHYWLADTCTNISLASLGPNQWHQMVAIHNGTNQQIYIDGILQNT